MQVAKLGREVSANHRSLRCLQSARLPTDGRGRLQGSHWGERQQGPHPGDSAGFKNFLSRATAVVVRLRVVSECFGDDSPARLARHRAIQLAAGPSPGSRLLTRGPPAEPIVWMEHFGLKPALDRAVGTTTAVIWLLHGLRGSTPCLTAPLDVVVSRIRGRLGVSR